MKDAFPRGQTAIVAAATYGVGTAPGLSTFDLAAHASVKALAQVGLKPKDVDGLFCVVMDETLSGLNFEEYLGVCSRINDNARTGGSSFQIQASIAALALASGQCDVALIAYGSNQRSALGKLATSARSSPWEAPYRPLRPISSYAMAAARHMHQYGTTKQQLGEVAIAARKWAQLNPDAFSRDELTLEDVPRRAHGRRSIQRPRLLPRHRWRSRRRHDARRSRARPVRETRVPAGRRARDARIAKSRACRTSQ